MAGEKLTQLRADLARIDDEIEAALAVDENADTAAREDQANDLMDQIGEILDYQGAQGQDEIKARPPREDPSASPGQLF
ncbi:hypothetical protein [Nocardia sp. NBC_01327]|uniref:hypothetical protein n=1 Tax=Nocardia sp. NBC_01327 TaxID=2903593 RepID=UPI002E1354C7|nr:hypothetical protein OG326_42340 [Nocardia sp. NBC_01327]